VGWPSPPQAHVLVRRCLQVNLTGCFLCREAMGLIESSGGGSFVNNASTAALVVKPGLEAYSAAKGFDQRRDSAGRRGRPAPAR